MAKILKASLRFVDLVSEERDEKRLLIHLENSGKIRCFRDAKQALTGWKVGENEPLT